jgi:hypothetical protein
MPMNCQTIRLLLPFLTRQNELGAEDWLAIDNHLATCDTCRALVEDERAFDRAIGQAMHTVTIPVNLREAINRRLEQEPSRNWRFRVPPWAAVAATFLLIALLTWRWYATRPLIDPTQWAEWEDQQFVLTYNGSRDSVIEFFQSRGLKTFVPADFDYTLLTRLDVIDIEGTPVATLAFQKGDHRAKVYVIPRRHFRVPNLPVSPATGSHCTVELVEVSRDYVLLIVYFGEANRQFFFIPGMIG